MQRERGTELGRGASKKLRIAGRGTQSCLELMEPKKSAQLRGAARKKKKKRKKKGRQQTTHKTARGRYNCRTRNLVSQESRWGKAGGNLRQPRGDRGSWNDFLHLTPPADFPPMVATDCGIAGGPTGGSESECRGDLGRSGSQVGCPQNLLLKKGARLRRRSREVKCMG